jgi:hypothetical protein
MKPRRSTKEQKAEIQQKRMIITTFVLQQSIEKEKALASV